MMNFQDLYASPAKSDASSVDIYDGLDIDNLTEESAKQSSPSRDCLDLYEEIITEEGTAKEASFNDLSSEYQKCQRQMKQLIIKLKEMQSMNTSLQNENLCLKKNISALMKTARVEITRKEEEINRLSQRLFGPGNTRYVKPLPLLLQSVNKTKLKDAVTPKLSRDMDSIGKEVKPQETSSKDASLSSKTKLKDDVTPELTRDMDSIRKELKPQETFSIDASLSSKTKLKDDLTPELTRDMDSIRKEVKPQETFSKDASLSSKTKLKDDVTPKRTRDMDSIRKEVKPQETFSKDASLSSKTKLKADVTPELTRDMDSIRKEVKPQETSSKDASLRSKTKLKDDVTPKRTRDMDSIRKELKPQETSSKDASLSSSPRKLSEKVMECVEESSSCYPKITPYDQQCKESAQYQSQMLSLGHNTDVDKRNKKEMDSGDQNTDRRQRKEGHSSSVGSSTNENSDVKEKTWPLPKCGKSEVYQIIKNSKSDVNYETDSRKHNSNSQEKLSATKETQLRDPPNSKEKHIKTYEKSCRRESTAYAREKNIEYRLRGAEKDDEPRRSKRTHFSNVKDDSYQKSPTFEKNDCKRSSDAGRRDKRSSDYSEYKHGIKDSKPSKSDINISLTKNKPNHENKSEKPDSGRRGDEKKRSRDEYDRSRNDRKHRAHQKGEMEIHKSSSKDKCEDLLHKANKSINSEKNVFKQKDNSPQKDLKLSFMETLNLTLSPAKKKSLDKDPMISVFNIECDVNEEKLTTDLSSKVCVRIENAANSEKCLNSPKQTDSRHNDPVSMEEMLVKTVPLDDSKLESISESVVENMVCQQEPAASTLDDNNAALAKLTLEDQQVIELDAVDSEELDTCSTVDGSDFIDLDAFIEIDKCSGSESPNSEKLNISTPAEHVRDEGVLEQSCEDVDNKTSDFKPNITETTKEMPPDVNTGTSCFSLSMELNKENCEPVIKANLGSDFPIEISSDEVEEGEIVSEEELISEQALQSISSPSQTDPDKEATVSKIPSKPNSELISLAKAKSPKQPAPKIKKKDRNCMKTKLSALPSTKRNKLTADSCLEGVLKIIPPSSIQDVLQMLRIIRKHIRKKYMKFKIQFSLTQFHRVIEAATLCFITLVSNLDWSNLCSSPQRLQNKLCKHIEFRLKQLKKNGIVDRIFEQRLIDMKKRLWKFVEEQLDSLFDTLKAVTLKLCDKAKIECDHDEQKTNTASCARTQKSLKNSQKSSKLKNKACLTKTVSVPCLRPLEFFSQTNVSNTKPQSVDVRNVEKNFSIDSTRVNCESEHGITPCKNISPTSNYSPHSPGKPISSTRLQKGQQSSTGLSFNLVSDDHMGDIFKSLLHDSDQLELHNLQEDWVLGTPEKTCSSSQKYETVDSMTENKTPIKAHFSWSSISPPHMKTLPRLETVLNPDVFDESCLLEIPTSASSGKSIASSDDRLKSYSSVLLEDLAVSLTVPSPLKSDSHLSFLRPVCDPESILEVNAHCNEDALLDEEDAIEQDIHLTLDSDNSSTGSLENAGEPGSFQCHPSEPMQAVIMEKSNDHFIVKIRRAVSSCSPFSECSSVEVTDNATSEQFHCVESSELCENVQREITDMKTSADTKSRSSSIALCSVDSSFSEVENRVESLTCFLPDDKSPSETKESVFKSPEIINQNFACTLETTSEIEVTDASYAEKGQIDNYESITSYTERTISSPVTCADGSPVKTPDANCMDFDLNKKKRKLSNEELSAKRQKCSSLSDTKAKSKTPRHSKAKDEGKRLVMEKSNKKHKRAVSDGALNSKHSPSSLSAKNVIKKKGEVVVSWTRDEDRAILLECQKLGPTEKTFLALSSKMNKYPYQVEERFRQLMKLFKKSKNCSS
ncbi:CASP8-associated protein 2 isoform X2 [Mixophyes fleayi]|uniref:CASP8-associated protein 2 isoform X2 n=1 Tax=Mixophyes fleayi TaxID=3061075 RepID=UPI003F4D73F4